ncbi:TPA: hypothetical protein N0F65_012247 [Lagenidium giganteum]|uniref:Uncharacterized protein n=1 Tax=Lagenidium giganteum TaxID=4803 RepID=A0AAV2ZIY7_9STRA|nr:TPA: hypothetical protein N0F65_012247 [Lagenidium giganteum]
MNEHEDAADGKLDDGWNAIAEALDATDLPPLPPTSDPQRLLRYVLGILPRYAEMEMMSTHLRLYTTTLEQDVEQLKCHIRMLARDVDSEREKRQFMERYAAQVVKERNELLHPKKRSKRESHHVWHSCCKKNDHHTLDLIPSIASFRGEKLQECTTKMIELQDAVQSHEALRRETDLLLKKAQREHDARTSADRRSIEQLEKQVTQRSMLSSSLERKLYELETVLACYNEEKSKEIVPLRDEVEALSRSKEAMESDNLQLRTQVEELEKVQANLMTEKEEQSRSARSLSAQLSSLTEKYTAALSEAESLRSEVDLLRSKDINDITSGYALKIQQLQEQSRARELELMQEVDRLKAEITAQHTNNARHNLLTRATNVDILSCDDSSLEEKESPDDRHEMRLSRSDLSDSLSSFSQDEALSECKSAGRALDDVHLRDGEEFLNWESFLGSSMNGSGRSMRSRTMNDTSIEQCNDTAASVSNLSVENQSTQSAEERSIRDPLKTLSTVNSSDYGESSTLAREISDVLITFSSKRKEQEAKAAKAHQALIQFQSQYTSSKYE